MRGDEFPIRYGGSARARRLGSSLAGLALCRVALGCLLLATSGAAEADEPRSDVKIAILGDQGLGSAAAAVLELIADEGAAAVLHTGDFDYEDDPAAWDAQIDGFLGPDFPYFAVVGNHDEDRFYRSGGYQDLLEARMNRLGIAWQGDLGVQSSFEWEGIFFVLTAPGVFGAGDGFHDLYIRDQLAANDSLWRISGWHENMGLMQTGAKGDATGWGVYEESRRGGALITTGHSHTYSRSHLLSSTEFQEVADTSDDFVFSADDPGTPEDEGRTVVVVSGLGGRSIREQHQDGPWWATVYTGDQGARPGALFGVFYEGGAQNRAHFYFKNVLGEVVDEFWVTSAVNAPLEPTLVIDHVETPEGDSGSHDAEIRVGLLAPDGSEVSVDYATSDLGATAGADYVASAGRLVFGPGEPYQSIRVPIYGDTIEEADESFSVDLSNPVNASLRTQSGTVTIVDDDEVSAEPVANWRMGRRRGGRREGVARLDRRPVLRENKSGAASDSITVSTTHALTAVEGNLYVATIASKSHVWVTEVTGLGLSWSPLQEECAGRGQTGVAVWQAVGTPDDDGKVTARFVSAPSNAVIDVARYAGRPGLRVNRVGAANSTGQPGVCSGGTDTADYQMEIDAGGADSRVVLAVAMRSRDHLPAAGFVERTEIYQGSAAGEEAGLSVAESSAFAELPGMVTGAFDSEVDWAAVFVEIQDGSVFALTRESAHGSLTAEPPGDSYREGTFVELTATPDPGYVFTGWGGDLPAGQTNPATLLMDDDKRVIAGFAPGFEVTVSSSPGGSVAVSPPSEGLYASGTVVTLEAQPDPGFIFGGWQGDVPSGAGSVASLLIDADKQVEARFRRVVEVEVAPTSGGSIVVDPPTGPYLMASTITLHAVPEQGFEFRGWTGDVPPEQGNPASVFLDDDKVVDAEFASFLVELQVEAIPAAGGSVALDPPGGVYPLGTEVTLVATPQPGFVFKGWTGDVPPGQDSPAFLQMDGDKNVSARFAAVLPELQEIASGGSSESASVATRTPVAAADGDLYLAAISAKPDTQVVAVSGLDLAWSPVRAQCGGRGQTGLSLWQARGQAGGGGTVTATLAEAPRNALIVVARYGGAPSLGDVVSANTLGVAGPCSGGQDGDQYAVDLDTTAANAIVYVAVAVRSRDHVPGPGFVETLEVHQGAANGDVAGVSVAESFVAEPGAVDVRGSVSSAVDWAVITTELKGAAFSYLEGREGRRGRRAR